MVGLLEDIKKKSHLIYYFWFPDTNLSQKPFQCQQLKYTALSNWRVCWYSGSIFQPSTKFIYCN